MVKRRLIERETYSRIKKERDRLLDEDEDYQSMLQEKDVKLQGVPRDSRSTSSSSDGEAKTTSGDKEEKETEKRERRDPGESAEARLAVKKLKE